MNSKEIGILGEKIAEKYLKEKGYKILEKNFKRKWGEIDIVAKKKNKLIFFEVKTLQQTLDEIFLPEDEVDFKKKKQLRKITQIYLSEKKIPLESDYQIDILAIRLPPRAGLSKMKIEHFENAIEDTF
ncbi:YraN family protein [bacterium (Candidatus Gribaldobacteria) CG_4_9_14_3_um_filter_33_9]|nr:MAG: YraN family protein [bacterium (Candidatus Gribaldobacteria) CG_4_9_14_3_um_filter_33_9]